MAPHSSTLAWKIPWTDEPGGCSPWGREESDTIERLDFHFSLLCIGEGNGNPLQCSCLENPSGGVAQSWTRLMWLSSSSSLKWRTKAFISTLYRLHKSCPRNLTHQSLIYSDSRNQMGQSNSLATSSIPPDKSINNEWINSKTPQFYQPISKQF